MPPSTSLQQTATATYAELTARVGQAVRSELSRRGLLTVDALSTALDILPIAADGIVRSQKLRLSESCWLIDRLDLPVTIAVGYHPTEPPPLGGAPQATCICPATCDCQAPHGVVVTGSEHGDSMLGRRVAGRWVSMNCPEHNDNPWAVPECEHVGTHRNGALDLSGN